MIKFGATVAAAFFGFAALTGIDAQAAGKFTEDGIKMNAFDKRVAQSFDTCNKVLDMQFKGKDTTNDGTIFVAYQFYCDNSHYPLHHAVAAVKNNKLIGIKAWDMYNKGGEKALGRANGPTHNFTTFKSAKVAKDGCFKDQFLLHGTMPDYHGNPSTSGLGGYMIYDGELVDGWMDCN